MDPVAANDSELVAQSLGGSREAFRQIVERYQTLICSLAYCATGNVSQSQDMAQETFIAAWKDLRALREPEKLRGWLCRIVRNLINKSHRRAGNDPVAGAAALEDHHEVAAVEALPCDQTITREEEAIMWRSLAQIPELYREPLVLFYREHQSIESVAAELEISEDAVKQRLSRGRKLLQEEVQTFVEKTLVRTAPGRQFSGAVLAALPLSTGSVATAGASLGAKGAATAKTGLFAVVLAPLAPFIGIFVGLITQLFIVRQTTTGRVRRIRTIELVAFWVLVPAVAVAGENLVRWSRVHFGWDDGAYFIARSGFWWLYAMFIAVGMVSIYRRMLATYPVLAAASARPAPAGTLTFPQRAMVSAGTHVAMYLWFIAAIWRMGDYMTAGLVVAVAVLLATGELLLDRNRQGLQLIRAKFAYTALCCGLILLVINLRLDTWLAAGRGVSLAVIHQIYPFWIIPVFTIALALFVAALAAWCARRDRHLQEA